MLSAQYISSCELTVQGKICTTNRIFLIADNCWLKTDLFPVNSLFLYIGITKTRNPCGFSRGQKKNPCIFPVIGNLEKILCFISSTAPPFHHRPQVLD